MNAFSPTKLQQQAEKMVLHNEQWAGPWVRFLSVALCPRVTTYDCCCLIIWQACVLAGRTATGANVISLQWWRSCVRRLKPLVFHSGMVREQKYRTSQNNTWYESFSVELASIDYLLLPLKQSIPVKNCCYPVSPPPSKARSRSLDHHVLNLPHHEGIQNK